jgi:hydroxymethylglutaryl-CoA lyase
VAQKKVEIIEIGPRDGFQNVSEFIPTDMKLKIIDGVIRSGIKSVQITSFVHPKAIPQMKDAKEIAASCLEKYSNIDFFALVPNLYGAKTAVECGLKEISYVISVSETHNVKNVKRTHDESFSELLELIKLYPGIKVNLDVATTFGCHYEGEIPLEKVMAFLKRAYGIGIKSFNLCDTVGLAHPVLVKEVVENALKEYPDCEFQIHIHDTRNMGIINSYAAIECGINKIQTSIGGLGGCPFAPGASGNTSTEDFVYMLNKMGYDTGIDFEVLLETAKLLKENVDGNYSGHHIFINKNKVCNQ